MENKGEKSADGEKQDDARIGLTAKYKAQKASGDRFVFYSSPFLLHLILSLSQCSFPCLFPMLLCRLSIGHKPPTLPDGVTMRDDPMTKTIAFLNAVPKLS